MIFNFIWINRNNSACSKENVLPEHEMSEKLVGGETGKQGYIVETIPC